MPFDVRLIYFSLDYTLPSYTRLFAFGFHQMCAVPQFSQEFFLQIVDGVVQIVRKRRNDKVWSFELDDAFGFEGILVLLIGILCEFYADADNIGFVPKKLAHFLAHDRLNGFGQFKMNGGDKYGSGIHACM